MAKVNDPSNKSPYSIQKRTRVLLGLIIGLSVLTIVGFTSNVVPYTYNVIRCGKLPIESNKLAASYTYRAPDDDGYGIHFGRDYNFCTVDEIKATNSYRRVTE